MPACLKQENGMQINVQAKRNFKICSGHLDITRVFKNIFVEIWFSYSGVHTFCCSVGGLIKNMCTHLACALTELENAFIIPESVFMPIPGQVSLYRPEATAIFIYCTRDEFCVFILELLVKAAIRMSIFLCPASCTHTVFGVHPYCRLH